MVKGGRIGKLNNPTNTSASGIWDVSEHLNATKSNIWYKKWISAENFFDVSNNPLDIHSWCSAAGLNACTIARDTAVKDSPYGGVPLRMSVTGNDPHIISYGVSTWNIATIANGETWQVRLLAKASVATTMEIFIFGATSTGTWASATGNAGSTTFNITTSWNEYSYSYTFANATVARLHLRLDGPQSSGTGQNLWFDGLQVYKLS